MKCPKCQYISFDSGERCRNCGYEFSLAADASGDASAVNGDLRIQDGTEAIGPFSDFALNDTPNLPLFTGRDSDAPLVTPSATPRVPLAVRRTAPMIPRARARRERDMTAAEPWLALDTADLPPPLEAPVASEAESLEQPPAVESDRDAAPIGARLAGGLVDLLLVAAIDVTVVYFTLRVCDLTFADIWALPMAPMLSFLALLDGGYLSTFVAASGQTIGKMAAGTRVVSAKPAAPLQERVSFGQSVVRAVAYLFSALPLGLGFVPALAGRDRRTFHDRLADTRVVKA